MPFKAIFIFFNSKSQEYNNYTGYVGAGNSYFHSVRPDYSGHGSLGVIKNIEF